MGMAEGHRQGIRRVALGFCLQLEYQLHHVLHLLLLRMTAADNGLLDAGRGVLRHLEAMAHRCADGGTSGLAQFQRGGGIFRHKDLFYGHHGRVKLIDDAGRGSNKNALFEDTLRMSAAALLTTDGTS